MSEQSKLIGWAAISEYVDLSERHLRRLVAKGEFRVQRVREGARSQVFAYVGDLDRLNRTYRQRSTKKKKHWRAIWVYLVPVFLLSVWVFTQWNRVNPQVRLVGFEVQGNQLILFDQFGNRKTVETMDERDKVSFRDVDWFPTLLEGPAVLRLSKTRQAIESVRWNERSYYWYPHEPQVASRLVGIYRIRSAAYDGIGIVWSEPQGFRLQIYSRAYTLIHTISADSDLIDLECDDRGWVTLCKLDGTEVVRWVWPEDPN